MTLEQLLGLNLEHVRQLFDRIERGRIAFVFEQADITSIEPCGLRQLLLA